MLLSLLLLTGSALGTPAGGKNNAACGNCVFPFIFRGEEHQACTFSDSSIPWCATTIHPNGTVVQYK